MIVFISIHYSGQTILPPGYFRVFVIRVAGTITCKFNALSRLLLTLSLPRTYLYVLKGHAYSTICDVISFSVRRYFWQSSARKGGNLAKHTHMRPIGWIELEFHANNLWTLRYKIKGKFALPTDGYLTMKISTFREAWAKTWHRQERLVKGQQNRPKKKTDKKETKRTGLRIKKEKSRQVEISISAHARS